MRGYDLRVVFAAGVKIMIDATDAHVFERADFVLAHQAKGTANIDADLFTNFFDGGGNLFNFFVRWTPPAVNDAIAHGSGFFGALGAFHELFLREKRVTVDRGFGHGRL